MNPRIWLSRRVLLCVSMLLGMMALADAWEIDWLSQFGSGLFTGSIGGGKTDATGVYTAGSTFPALPGQIPAGATDAYIRKFSFDGLVLWTRQFGTPRSDLVSGIATGQGGVFVVGWTDGAFSGSTNAGGSDAFVRKYDQTGGILWTTQFGTPQDDRPFAGAIEERNGALYVAGFTAGTFPGEPVGEGQDVYIARLDSQTGAVLWIRQFGVRGITFGIGGLTVDDTGVYAASTVSLGTAIGDPDYGLFRKFDLSGNPLWSRQIKGAVGCSLAVWGLSAHADAIYLVGQANRAFLDDPVGCQPRNSAIVGSLRKYDAATGTLIWTRRIQAGSPSGGDGFTGAKIVHATDSGVYVGANATDSFPGYLPSAPRSDRALCPGLSSGNSFADKLDAYVRRYDSDGNVMWTHQFGSGVFDLVTGIGSDPSAIYISGDTSCSVQEDALYSGGNRDSFVARLTIDPATISGRVELLVGQIEALRDRGRLGPGDFVSLQVDLERALAIDRQDATTARQALEAFIENIGRLARRGDLSTAEVDPVVAAASAIIAGM